MIRLVGIGAIGFGLWRLLRLVWRSADPGASDYARPDLRKNA